MAVEVAQKHMTTAEFLNLPETSLPTELINGEVIVSPASVEEHQRTLFRIARVLEHLVPNGEVFIAPLDVYFDERNTVQPDIFWVAAGGACISVDGMYRKGSPDLIIEVLSPGTALRDKREKFQLYEKYGVHEYWLADPYLRVIEVWQWLDGHFKLVVTSGAGKSFTSPLLGLIDGNAIFPASPAVSEQPKAAN